MRNTCLSLLSVFLLLSGHELRAQSAQPKDFFGQGYVKSDSAGMLPKKSKSMTEPTKLGLPESSRDVLGVSVTGDDKKSTGWLVSPEPEGTGELEKLAVQDSKISKKDSTTVKKTKRPDNSVPAEVKLQRVKRLAEAKAKKDAKIARKQALKDKKKAEKSKQQQDKKSRAEQMRASLKQDFTEEKKSKKEMLTIEKIQLVLSTRDEAKLFQGISEFAGYIDRFPIKDAAVHIVGPLTFRGDMPKDWHRIVQAGYKIYRTHGIIQELKIERSPAWVIETEEGIVLMEAADSIDQYISEDGKFPRRYLGLGDLERS